MEQRKGAKENFNEGIEAKGTKISNFTEKVLLNPLFCRDNKAEAIWEKEKNELYRQIGEVTVERDWLKKKLQTLT